jgi:hypothetical protein
MTNCLEFSNGMQEKAFGLVKQYIEAGIGLCETNLERFSLIFSHLGVENKPASFYAKGIVYSVFEPRNEEAKHALIVAAEMHVCISVFDD